MILLMQGLSISSYISSDYGLRSIHIGCVPYTKDQSKRLRSYSKSETAKKLLKLYRNHEPSCNEASNII